MRGRNRDLFHPACNDFKLSHHCHSKGPGGMGWLGQQKIKQWQMQSPSCGPKEPLQQHRLQTAQGEGLWERPCRSWWAVRGAWVNSKPGERQWPAVAWAIQGQKGRARAVITATYSALIRPHLITALTWVLPPMEKGHSSMNGFRWGPQGIGEPGLVNPGAATALGTPNIIPHCLRRAPWGNWDLGFVQPCREGG